MYTCHLHSIFIHMLIFIFFFFNDTATTEIYTLSLHDALPIYLERTRDLAHVIDDRLVETEIIDQRGGDHRLRSEEHTSELQSRSDLVCRLLLEKKKKNKKIDTSVSSTSLT